MVETPLAVEGREDEDDEREALVPVRVEAEQASGSSNGGGGGGGGGGEGGGSSNRYVFVLTALSAIGGFLFGYDTGVISGAMLLLVEEFGFNHKEQEMIVSVTLAGCILAAVGASVATEKLGRQPVILLGSAIFAGASLMLATAATFEGLLLGRFVVGLAVGLASMAVPVYIAEAAPPEMRGKLVSINNVFLTGGQFVACVVDALFAKVDYPHGWRWMLGLAAVPAVVMFVGFMFLPESPRWLAQHKGEAEARAVLQQIRGGRTSAVDAELAGITAAVRADEALVQAGLWQALQEAPLRRSMVLGCMLQLVQQLTGINTVMYYCGTIFVMAGFTDPAVAIWLTAGVSFVGCVCCMLGVVAVERMGRRRLTLLSLAGVVLSLLALGGGFKYSASTSPPVLSGSVLGSCDIYSSCFDCVADAACGFCPASAAASADGTIAGYCVAGNVDGPVAASDATVDDALILCAEATKLNRDAFMLHTNTSGRHLVGSWYRQSCPNLSGGTDTASSMGGIISLLATASYLAAFQPGMGTMPWTINSEIYPLHARSLGVSVATATNWCSNLLISYTFLDLTRAAGNAGAFWIYAAIGAFGWLWLYFNLPETRGLALEEIQQLFIRASDHQVLSSADAEEATQVDGNDNVEENHMRDSKGDGEEEKLIKGSVM